MRAFSTSVIHRFLRHCLGADAYDTRAAADFKRRFLWNAVNVFEFNRIDGCYAEFRMS